MVRHVADDVADCAIPPGMVITLTENAIKHGIEPSPRGGRVDVAVERDGATLDLVADTGAGLASGLSAGGIGLANIRERMALLYGDRATLSLEENEPAGFRARHRPARLAQRAGGLPPMPCQARLH